MTLLACANTVGIALAGCLGDDGTDEWEPDEDIPATTATIYMGPNCACCEEYAKYLDESITANLETVTTGDLTALKDDRGIDDDLRSCHTVALDEYVVEGHVPAETVGTLMEEQPAIAGIALPGMPAGSPGMGGEKTTTWTVYEIRPGEEPTVYAEL